MRILDTSSWQCRASMPSLAAARAGRSVSWREPPLVAAPYKAMHARRRSGMRSTAAAAAAADPAYCAMTGRVGTARAPRRPRVSRLVSEGSRGRLLRRSASRGPHALRPHPFRRRDHKGRKVHLGSDATMRFEEQLCLDTTCAIAAVEIFGTFKFSDLFSCDFSFK